MSICSWLRKASCLVWTEKNVSEERKKKTRMRRRLHCGFHFNLWVSHKRQEGTKRETILGWLLWQHNKQGGMDVSIAMPCVCKNKYHVPRSSFYTVKATLLCFVVQSFKLFLKRKICSPSCFYDLLWMLEHLLQVWSCCCCNIVQSEYITYWLLLANCFNKLGLVKEHISSASGQSMCSKNNSSSFFLPT